MSTSCIGWGYLQSCGVLSLASSWSWSFLIVALFFDATMRRFVSASSMLTGGHRIVEYE